MWPGSLTSLLVPALLLCLKVWWRENVVGGNDCKVVIAHAGAATMVAQGGAAALASALRDS